MIIIFLDIVIITGIRDLQGLTGNISMQSVQKLFNNELLIYCYVPAFDLCNVQANKFSDTGNFLSVIS